MTTIIYSWMWTPLPPTKKTEANKLLTYAFHREKEEEKKKSILLKSLRTGASQFLLSVTFILYYKFILRFAFCDTPLRVNRKPMV